MAQSTITVVVRCDHATATSGSVANDVAVVVRDYLKRTGNQNVVSVSSTVT